MTVVAAPSSAPAPRTIAAYLSTGRWHSKSVGNKSGWSCSSVNGELLRCQYSVIRSNARSTHPLSRVLRGEGRGRGRLRGSSLEVPQVGVVPQVPRVHRQAPADAELVVRPPHVRLLGRVRVVRLLDHRAGHRVVDPEH